MEIENLSAYSNIIYRLADHFEEFENFVENQTSPENVREFIDLDDLDTFRDLKEDIDRVKIPKRPYAKKAQVFKERLTAYLYSNFIKFIITDKVKGVPIFRKFIPNIIAILNNKNCVHHSHITGDIVGHAHTFCNENVRGNYYKIPVIAHNLFRFDFFFLIKVLRAGVWKTRDITKGGKNPTDINFASIDNQVQFIDTIKYFQQSLGGHAGSLTSSEKTKIRRQSHLFLVSNPKTHQHFVSLSKEDQEWVLDYLSTGKGVIPYQLITDFDLLNISPRKEFFDKYLFYSSLKDSRISSEDYENVKKFYTLLKLQNLGELSRIYNFQDTIILCEIFEQRSELLKERFKYNPKKCNSASSFSGCFYRNKSKCSIALPTDVEFARVFEKTLI